MKFVIPGRTKSTANLREHHHAKAKRFAAERRKAMQLCPKWEGPPLLVVTLFRFGARELDSDNLANSLKAHRDGIAARLKVDDGSRLVAWEYHQATCPFGEERVEVVIRLAGLLQPEKPIPGYDQLTVASRPLWEDRGMGAVAEMTLRGFHSRAFHDDLADSEKCEICNPPVTPVRPTGVPTPAVYRRRR